MRRLVINTPILVVILMVFFAMDVSAWDTNAVHPYITSSAFDKASNLGRFLGDFGLTNKSFDSQDSRDFGPHDAKEWI